MRRTKRSRVVSRSVTNRRRAALRPAARQVSKASDMFSIYKLTDEDKAQILRLAADKNIGAPRGSCDLT